MYICIYIYICRKRGLSTHHTLAITHVFHFTFLRNVGRSIHQPSKNCRQPGFSS